MAVKLVSDLHGRFGDLQRVVSPDDTLMVLGDILDLIDWADLSGILPQVVGRERFMARLQEALRGGPEAAAALRADLLSPQGRYFHEISERSRSQYEEFARTLRSIGCRAYVIYGNGDFPDLLQEALRGVEGVELAAGRVEVDGTLFGFVPGAVHSPFRMPAEMEDASYGERLEELGGVEVLCTHIPPRVQEAVFDVVAGRPVEGSEALRLYLHRHRPRVLYHGHVHQPAQKELLVGETRVVNVGYYKRQGQAHLHR